MLTGQRTLDIKNLNILNHIFSLLFKKFLKLNLKNVVGKFGNNHIFKITFFKTTICFATKFTGIHGVCFLLAKD